MLKQKAKRPPRGSRTTGPTLRCRTQRSGALTAYAVFNGQFISFGRYGDPQAAARFAQLKAQWEANGRRLPTDCDAADQVSVEGLAGAFLVHAELHYRRRDGKATGSAWHFKQALEPLLALYRDQPVAQFDLQKLKAVRQSMVEARRRPRPRSGCSCPATPPDAPPRYSRRTINRLVGLMVHVFRWGVGERLCPGTVAAELREIRPLQAGRSLARETQPRRPVPEADMRATLPHLPRRVAAMVECMWLTGMRCGEVVQLRTCDVVMTSPIWRFRPTWHKNLWRERAREIDLGPQTQSVLRSWIKLEPAAYWFDPREQVAEQLAADCARAVPTTRADRSPGAMYSTRVVAQAIERACRRAKVEHWSPHQLRHAALSRIREKFGLEAAQVVGGHASLPMTEAYTRDAERHLAQRVAAEVG